MLGRNGISHPVVLANAFKTDFDCRCSSGGADTSRKARNATEKLIREYQTVVLKTSLTLLMSGADKSQDPWHIFP